MFRNIVGLALLAIFIIFLLISGCAKKSPIKPNSDNTNPQLSLTVSFINIRGSIGDATLITVSQGENTLKSILIDAGDWSQAESYVVPYISSIGLSRINFVIATHYHSDHIGGIPVVVSTFTVDSVLDRGYSYDSQPYRIYYNSVQNKRRAIQRGDTLWLAESSFVACVAVNGNGIVPDPRDSLHENDLSAAFHIKFGKFDLFVGGDLTGGGNGTYDIESSIANDVGRIEVYKVNHHGSATSSNPNFLERTRPKVSVISVGNYRGLPDPDVCDRLRTYGELYITKIDGTVEVKVIGSSADSFEVKTSTTGIDTVFQCHID